jgi:exonuclease III
MFKKLVNKAETVITKVMRWIVGTMTKWKNQIQISVHSSVNNEQFLTFTITLCKNNIDKNETLCLVSVLSILRSRLAISKVNRIKNLNRLLTDTVEIRWNIWISIMISTCEMISRTIYLDLLRQNIESNPGMDGKRPTFSITTYNCNGLGDKKKLRRLLAKADPIVRKGGVILLQETHLTDTNYLKLIWKHNFVSNCIKSNSAGVMILFNKDYDIVDTYSDNKGRNLIAVLLNGDTKFIISNAYLPNDHREGITFAEEMYLKILEYQYKYPEYVIIAGGDMNVCMNEKDLINRNSSTAENSLSDSIRNNNKITNMTDAYRFIHKEGGYTWKKGKLLI